MKIGLVDVDGHNYPNLCLMKISSYYKERGHEVEWHQVGTEYDIVYLAKVFSDTYTKDYDKPIIAKQIIKGGTGYAISLVDGKEVYDKSKDPELPPEIEHIYPDYSLYPEYTGYGQKLKKQRAFGFLTRGCIRNCGFCHVCAKEGGPHKVANLDEFWRGQGQITLNDPNILACGEWRELLQQLVDSEAKIEFNQGLDARLITPEKAELLASMNLKTPHFAMDSMGVIEPVARGLKLYVDACKRIKGKWNWRNGKVFCLVNFDTTLSQDLERIRKIQECECYPYVMVYNKPSAHPIIKRLQRWTNNTMFYAKYPDFWSYQKGQVEMHHYREVIWSADPRENEIYKLLDTMKEKS